MRALAMLVLAAAGAAAQTPQGSVLPERLAPETRAALTRLADSARAAGLPAEPIVAKAAEGVLKGADDARILKAARSLVAELGAARLALPGASASVLTAAASALHAGATPRLVRDLREAASARGNGRDRDADLAVALISVADLAASGVQAERAGSAISQLLRRGAPEAEITAFRASVARDISEGAGPEQALSARMRGRPTP